MLKKKRSHNTHSWYNVNVTRGQVVKSTSLTPRIHSSAQYRKELLSPSQMRMLMLREVG